MGAFLPMCNVSLAPRMGDIWPLDSLLKQGFAALCSCHDCYLKVFRGESLVIYPVLVVAPILESKQETGCKYLTRSPPISCLCKCKQGVYVYMSSLKSSFFLPQEM